MLQNKLQPFIDRYDEISDLLVTEEVLSDIKKNDCTFKRAIFSF